MNERAIELRFGPRFLPFRVRPEVRPCLLAVSEVFEGEHVPELIAPAADSIDPVADVLDAVLFEQTAGVVAETGLKGGQLSRMSCVDAELIDHHVSPRESAVDAQKPKLMYQHRRASRHRSLSSDSPDARAIVRPQTSN